MSHGSVHPLPSPSLYSPLPAPPLTINPVDALSIEIGKGSPAVRPEVCRDLAQGWIRSAEDGHLDIQDGGEVLSRLPARGWQLLLMVAGAGEPIESITLPPMAPDNLNDLLRSLAVLSGQPLKEISINAQRLIGSKTLDLIVLDPLALKRIEIREAPEELSRLVIPEGVKITLAQDDEGGPRSRKMILDTVARANASGQDKKNAPHTLRGLAYIRTGKPATLSDDEKSIRDRQACLNLNGQARFASTAQGTPTQGTALHIWCRHLALQWLQDRLEHLGTKGAATAGGFSYAPYTSTEALSAHLDTRLDRAFEEVIDRCRPEFFDGADFGQVVAEHAQKMRPGQALHFLLTSHQHVMALEIQCKAGTRKSGEAPRYNLTFYDPNRTAADVRFIADSIHQLGDLGLVQLMGAERVTGYFGLGPSKIACLHPLTQPPAERSGKEAKTSKDEKKAADASGLVNQVSRKVRQSPDYLHRVLAENSSHKQLKDALDAAIAHPDHASLPERLMARVDGRPGLWMAMGRNRSECVRGYVTTIIDLAVGKLGTRQTSDLLRSDHHGELAGTPVAGDAIRVSALTIGLLTSPTCVRTYLETLLEQGPGRLDEDLVEELLAGGTDRDEGSCLFDAAHRAKRSFESGRGTDDLSRFPDGVHAYIQTLSAHERVDWDQLARVLLDGEDHSFIGVALDQAMPEVAAAAACALLESGRALPDCHPVLSDTMLGRIRLMLPDTPSARTWAARLEQALASTPAGRSASDTAAQTPAAESGTSDTDEG